MLGRILVLPLLLTLGLSACDLGSGPYRSGRMAVLLTDAPGDLVSAVVTIEKIYLQGDPDSDQEDGRVYLLETPTTANLLDLQNEILALADAPVPGGRYAQLRVVISGGYIEVVEAEDSEGIPTLTRIYATSPEYAAENGVTADGVLQMPSYASSGLKIKLPEGGVQIDGDQKIILLDFNVGESFGKPVGQAGMWNMAPVIYASDFSTTVGVEFSLALAEGVSLPNVGGVPVSLADFSASLDDGGDLITEPFVEQDGVFRARFRYLAPNTDYPVALIEPGGVDATVEPVFPASVNVPSGTLTESFEITSAVPE